MSVATADRAALEVLVFASHEQPVRFAAARALVGELLARGHKARLVDKLTSDLDLLILVAEYGVVEDVVLVFREGARPRARRTTLLSVQEVEAAFAHLTSA